jgi:hypothetical protein
MLIFIFLFNNLLIILKYFNIEFYNYYVIIIKFLNVNKLNYIF